MSNTLWQLYHYGQGTYVVTQQDGHEPDYVHICPVVDSVGNLAEIISSETMDVAEQHKLLVKVYTTAIKLNSSTPPDRNSLQVTINIKDSTRTKASNLSALPTKSAYHNLRIAADCIPTIIAALEHPQTKTKEANDSKDRRDFNDIYADSDDEDDKDDEDDEDEDHFFDFDFEGDTKTHHSAWTEAKLAVRKH